MTRVRAGEAREPKPEVACFKSSQSGKQINNKENTDGKEENPL